MNRALQAITSLLWVSLVGVGLDFTTGDALHGDEALFLAAGHVVGWLAFAVAALLLVGLVSMRERLIAWSCLAASVLYGILTADQWRLLLIEPEFDELRRGVNPFVLSGIWLTVACTVTVRRFVRLQRAERGRLEQRRE